ncbi:MAG: Rid family hydrolase [Pseudomonadota bacterium]|nr:Rid family hydrolase [Pseudomonadota bacterium]
MSNTPINPDTLFKPMGFHQVVTSTGNKTIHIAGQGAFDTQMKLQGKGDYKVQTQKALQNLALALEAAGATPQDIVSSHVFVKGLNPEVSAQVGEGMMTALEGKPFPIHATSLIGIDALVHPQMLVEISAVAMIKE